MWLVPAVEKFPHTQKFLLGDRIQTTALDVLECDTATASRAGVERLSEPAGAWVMAGGIRLNVNSQETRAYPQECHRQRAAPGGRDG
jgi:hypothetical protein